MGAVNELVERFGTSVTVEQFWEKYAALCLTTAGVARGSVQWNESKKVFFAAWQGCLEFSRVIIGHPGMDEEKGAAALQRMDDECDAFKEKVLRGEV